MEIADAARGSAWVRMPMHAFMQEVLEDLEHNSHVGLCQTLREHAFVGHVKVNSVLLQHRTKLMLVNMSCLSADLMYQQAISNYMNFSSITIEDAPKVAELLMIGLESREVKGQLQQEDENKVRCRSTAMLSHAEAG